MKNVADIYPVSPMQESMLLRLFSKADSDLLFNQFCYEIKGDLEVAGFRQAWQQVIDRHPALRTAFVCKHPNPPLQIVRQKLEIPFQSLDWQALGADDQARELESFCRKDRQLGFDIAKAPLTRVTLIRCSASRFYLIWSSHHLLLDRWCLAMVYTDLFAFYAAHCSGRPPRLQESRPFREYVSWIQRQDRKSAAAYWRTVLRGFTTATTLTIRRKDREESRGDKPTEEQWFELSDAASASLVKSARGRGLTLSSFVQGAWSFVINHYTGRDDIVFGATVSGRPPDLNGVENIVGSFINNLPVRVTLRPEAELVDWLKDLQSKSYKRSPFEYVSLSDIQNWSELSPTDTIFDTLFIWLSPDEMMQPEELEFRALRGEMKTAYPLTISVEESRNRITLRGIVHPAYRTVVPLEELMQSFRNYLQRFCDCDDHCRLDGIQGYVAATHQPSLKAGTGVFVDLSEETGSASAAATGGRENVDLSVIQELVLCEWQQLLKIEKITLDDNFFDLGGNSLLAARLQSQLELASRKVIPMLSLFQRPTVRGMTETLHAEQWPVKPGMIFPIRARGTTTPLFCIASPEVNTVGYSLLARHLENDRPFYIIQLPPDTDRIRRLNVRELPEVASSYIHAMQQIQPRGPYNLLGMCTGAQLSFEMAKQLSTAGYEVGFLGILDTWSLHTLSRGYYLKKLVDRTDYYVGRLGTLLRMEAKDRTAQLLDIAKKRWKRGQLQKVRDAAGIGAHEVGISDRIQSEPDKDDWFVDFGWPDQIGNLSKYRGVVTVFRLRKQHYWRIRDPALGWRMHAESVDVRKLSGTRHSEILREPLVREVAMQLQHCLERDSGTTIDTERPTQEAQ